MAVKESERKYKPYKRLTQEKIKQRKIAKALGVHLRTV